jgi:glycosyltransferase involved in cell wall biosynthesis
MPQIVVLINGTEGSAAAKRAQGLFTPLADRYKIHYAFRDAGKIGSLQRFFLILKKMRPDLVYVIDTAISGAGAALLARIFYKTPFIMDTGDLGYELAALTANPGWAGRMVIRAVESSSLALARAVVVRGTYHQQLLEGPRRPPVFVIRDGIHAQESRPLDVSALRSQLGLDGFLCVGLMGSLKWNRRHQMCYGWDLIEAMALLDPSLPVRALVIGDGDGLAKLQARVKELNLDERIHFVGRVPYAQVAEYTNLLDIALSTQTNNRVGNVRTTGKLPEYMAAGCYVLATDVGEARLLLPPEMRMPYHGVKDTTYPERLAKKIAELAKKGRSVVRQTALKNITRAHCELEYDFLSQQLEAVLTNFAK